MKFLSPILKRYQREKTRETIDMVGNINDFMNLCQQMRQNPMQLLSQRFNIPQNVNVQDPNAIIQHLLNTGQISQQQVNQAMQMRNNPVFKQFIKN